MKTTENQDKQSRSNKQHIYLKLSLAFSFLLGLINIGNTDYLKNASPDFKKAIKNRSLTDKREFNPLLIHLFYFILSKTEFNYIYQKNKMGACMIFTVDEKTPSLQ